MTTTTKVAALTATALATIAAVTAVGRDGESRRGSGVPPKIYGRTRPAPAPPAVPGAGAQRDLARRWALAWTTASSCGDARSLGRVLALSGGELARSLRQAPPRPVAGVACNRHPRVVSIVLIPHGGGATAIVERPGEAGGDAHLEINVTQTAAGLRAVALDY